MLAMTVDGKIAKNTDHAADWTSKEDKEHFVKLTKEAGAIIMGRNTYDTIGKPLPGRLNLILTSTPEEYKNVEEPGLLEFFKGTPQEACELLKKRKFEKVILGGGASINQAFIKYDLIDEIYLTVEPKLFGRGVGIFTDSIDRDLELIDFKKINSNSLQLQYRGIK